MNNTFWVIGNEIELSPEGLKPVMDIIDKAGQNDARQIAYALLLQLMSQLSKSEVKEELPDPKVPAEPPTKEFTHYAYLRPDLVEAGELPPLNDIDRDEELFLPRDLMTTKFPCSQPDELDYQEYNMLIILPNGKLYGAKTIDFEFEPIPEPTEFTVAVGYAGYDSHDFKVTARTQEEANALAIEEAGNHCFAPHTSEYEIL